MQMAAILELEERLVDALATYLEVCYLDINGSINLPIDGHGRLLSGDDPAFSPDLGFLAPVVIGQVGRVAERLRLNQGEVAREFLERANKIWNQLNLPTNPKVAWERILPELYP